MSKADSYAIDFWRDLGIYYDLDDRVSVNQWRLYGSRKGIETFAAAILEYGNNPRNAGLSEHEHYGPYSYLKIVTWNKPVFTANAWNGTIPDLKLLAELILSKLAVVQTGQTFSIDQEYGVDNEVTVKFFVMHDDFDPVSMDELIMSQRQDAVNALMKV